MGESPAPLCRWVEVEIFYPWHERMICLGPQGDVFLLSPAPPATSSLTPLTLIWSVLGFTMPAGLSAPCRIAQQEQEGDQHQQPYLQQPSTHSQICTWCHSLACMHLVTVTYPSSDRVT
jgi:hypothetical protein